MAVMADRVLSVSDLKEGYRLEFGQEKSGWFCRPRFAAP